MRIIKNPLFLIALVIVISGAVAAAVLLVKTGESEYPVSGKDVLLANEGDIASAVITLSGNPAYGMRFMDESSVKKLASHFKTLKVTSDFAEDPEKYSGDEYAITFEYKDGTKKKITHLGNLFIRSDSERWYKMDPYVASEFEKITDSLIPQCKEFDAMKSGTYSMLITEEHYDYNDYTLLAYKDGALAYAPSDENGDLCEGNYILFDRTGGYTVDPDKKTYEKYYDLWFDDDFFDFLDLKNDYKCVSYLESENKREFRYQDGGRHIIYSYENGKLTGIAMNLFYYEDTEFKPLLFSPSVPDSLYFKITGELRDGTVDRLKEETPEYFELTSGKITVFALVYSRDWFGFFLSDGERMLSEKELNKMTAVRGEEVKAILEYRYADIPKKDIRIIPYKERDLSEFLKNYTIDNAVEDLKEIFGEGYGYAAEFYDPYVQNDDLVEKSA